MEHFDRFISQRGVDGDASMAFTTKMQLFASPQKKFGNETPTTSEKEMNEQEDGNKTYQALLQNQILGIDNAYLLHEIHNSEDYHQS